MNDIKTGSNIDTRRKIMAIRNADICHGMDIKKEELFFLDSCEHTLSTKPLSKYCMSVIDKIYKRASSAIEDSQRLRSIDRAKKMIAEYYE